MRLGSWVGLVRREVAIGKTVDFEEVAVLLLAYTVFQINRVHRVDVPSRISLIVHFALLAAICSFSGNSPSPPCCALHCWPSVVQHVAPGGRSSLASFCIPSSI